MASTERSPKAPQEDEDDGLAPIRGERHLAPVDRLQREVRRLRTNCDGIAVHWHSVRILILLRDGSQTAAACYHLSASVMRIILFSGRGGSGVSTLSAATAVATSSSGKPTLAFSLGSGLGHALGVDAAAASVTKAGDNLDLVQGASVGADEFRDWLADLLDFRSMDRELADDFAALPGLNHIGRLLELEELIASGRYGVIVLDAAPLEMFLDLPGALESAARWLKRVFSSRSQSVFEPLVRAFAADYANTGEGVFATGRELLTRLASLRDLMIDQKTTSVRLVVTAEGRAPEALREASGVLSLFGYLQDAVVVTRLLPHAERLRAPRARLRRRLRQHRRERFRDRS